MKEQNYTDAPLCLSPSKNIKGHIQVSETQVCVLSKIVTAEHGPSRVVLLSYSSTHLNAIGDTEPFVTFC